MCDGGAKDAVLRLPFARPRNQARATAPRQGDSSTAAAQSLRRDRYRQQHACIGPYGQRCGVAVRPSPRDGFERHAKVRNHALHSAAVPRSRAAQRWMRSRCWAQASTCLPASYDTASLLLQRQIRAMLERRPMLTGGSPKTSGHVGLSGRRTAVVSAQLGVE